MSPTSHAIAIAGRRGRALLRVTPYATRYPSSSPLPHSPCAARTPAPLGVEQPGLQATVGDVDREPRAPAITPELELEAEVLDHARRTVGATPKNQRDRAITSAT